MARETRRDDPAEPSSNGDRSARETVSDRPWTSGDGDDPLFRWPDELDQDWILLNKLRGGGESALFLVRGRHPGTEHERIIKIYNEGAKPRDEIIERLERFDPTHVLRMYEHRTLGSRWVEFLEYVRHGSLEDLIKSEGLDLGPDRIREIIEELHAAVAHIHEADVVHRDIKPGNILVRSLEPLDLVLTDFGIASYLDGFSVRETTGSRTEAYAAPEAVRMDVTKVSDWWSVGMLLVELLTGRHPFARADSNGLITSGQITKRLENQDVEELVAGVPEPYLLLCRGLLRREIGNRWDDEKVDRWLKGDQTLMVDPEVPPGRAPFRFAGTGREHYQLKDVARALAEHWPEAVASYGRGELQAWLERACDQGEMLAAVREIDEGARRGDLPYTDALFRTIVAIDPAIAPSYRGHQLNDAGLDRLASDALARDPTAAEIVKEIFELGCLSTYSAMRGTAWHLETERLWQEQVRAYAALAPLVPEDARRVLELNLPLAVAAGLRGSLPGQAAWAADLRQQAWDDRIRLRHAPAWYVEQLEPRIPRLPSAALVGLRAVRPLAESEAAAEMERRRDLRAVAGQRVLTAAKVLGLIAVAAIALLGILSLVGIR